MERLGAANPPAVALSARVRRRSKRKRKLVAGMLALVLVSVLVLATLVAAVLIPARRDFIAVRAVLQEGPATVTADDLVAAVGLMEATHARLGGPVARVAGVFPVVRQNLAALEAASAATIPMLRSGAELLESFDGAIAEGLFEGGVDLELVTALGSDLERQAEAFAGLEQALREHRNGWLLPPLWSALDQQLASVREMRAAADKAVLGAALAEPMLGGKSRRTYLVALMNNAEARGAGGIPSGLGILSLSNGKLKLGSFDYFADLGDTDHPRVAAPPDFVRRFGQHGADTTFFPNITMSPDAPEAALVAARAYRLRTGIETDGVILADPHGVAALLPRDATVTVPETGRELTPDQVPAYVMSDAYAELGGPEPERRTGLLELGREGFKAALTAGVTGRGDMERMAAAVAGGHLRIVSFSGDEAGSLETLGASGALGAPERDGLFVTVQNLGADKLDYWAEQKIAHRCALAVDNARCATQVSVRNTAPAGLPEYVTQGKRRATLESFVEMYVPVGSDLGYVTLDGEPAYFRRQTEDRWASVGVPIQVPREQTATIELGYNLPLDAAYSLEVRAQPLARPAELTVEVRAPEGWVVRAPSADGAFDGVRFTGMLDSPKRFRAAPDERTGISSLWERLTKFWREPVSLPR